MPMYLRFISVSGFGGQLPVLYHKVEVDEDVIAVVGGVVIWGRHHPHGLRGNSLGRVRLLPAGKNNRYDRWSHTASTFAVRFCWFFILHRHLIPVFHWFVSNCEYKKTLAPNFCFDFMLFTCNSLLFWNLQELLLASFFFNINSSHFIRNLQQINSEFLVRYFSMIDTTTHCFEEACSFCWRKSTTWALVGSFFSVILSFSIILTCVERDDTILDTNLYWFHYRVMFFGIF